MKQAKISYAKRNIIGMLLIATLLILNLSLISALKFGEVLGKINIQKNEAVMMMDNKEIEYNPLWEKYAPIKIVNAFGLGSTLLEGAIIEHTETCEINCHSNIQIYLANKDVLIQDIRFYTINKDKSRTEQPIRNYQFYIKNKEDWIPYKIGEEIEAGTYEIKLEGQKKPERTVDWQIKINGIWITDWALWNGLNYIYDELDDSSINATLWSYGITGSLGPGTLPTVTEDADSLTAACPNALCSGACGSGSAWFNATNLTVLNQIMNMSMRVVTTHLIVSGHGTPAEYFMIFGTKIIENTADDSVWSIIRNYTCINCFDVYNDGVYTQTIAATNNNLYAYAQVTIGGSGTKSSASVSVYYVYYALPNIFLNSPYNNYISPSTSIIFNCSSIINPGANLTNISLWTNSSGSWELNTTQTMTGITNTSVFSNNYSDNQSFIWTCQACDSDNDCGFAHENRTVSINDAAPSITINFPTALLDFGYINKTEILNWTVDDVNLASIWYNYNGTNITIYGATNFTNFTIANSPHNLTLYANDTAGNVNSSYISWNYTIFKNSEIYNKIAYETSIEIFQINITYDSTKFSLISSILYYNGTSQGAATVIGTGNAISFYDTVNIPLTNAETFKNFYWSINLTYLNGSKSTINTNIQNQTVKNIYFMLCNDTINTTYINFTTKDEMSPWPYINSTIPSATFNYWLGDGSITKQYVYGNSTEYPSHGFCFSPGYKTLNLNYIYQIGSLGYYTRIFNSLTNLQLTNSSTNKLFYLIQSADSGPVVIQIIDSITNTILPGATVTIVRDINGVPTEIFAGISDSAGAVVVYLSSLVSYTITVTKTGCGTNSQTIIPATGSYTMNLNCGGNTTKFVSQIDGVSYQHTPKDGISIPGTIAYGYSVTSVIYPIYSAKFELYDSIDNTLLGSNQTDVSSGYVWCNTNNCTLTLISTTSSGDNVKGKYYVNLGNVTNNTWILLEGDAYWRYININPNNSQQAWNRILLQFNEFMDAWGSKSANCIVYKTNATCVADSACKWVNQSAWGPEPPDFRTDISLCVLRDDINKMEFNRILIIFSGIVLILFILGKTIGYEMSNPGSFVMIMSMCIIILSIGGLFKFNGLTQYDWFNQYVFAYICTVFSAGYSLSIIRRYSA